MKRELQPCSALGHNFLFFSLCCSFFHRDLSRTEAEKLLKECQTSGTFLVRTSKTKSDAYVLSVRYVGKRRLVETCFFVSARRTNGEILHRHIQKTQEGFALAECRELFATLYDLIDFYRRNSYELSDKINEPIALTQPLLASTPTNEK